MLSGVSRANAKDMHLDVWDCVETYIQLARPLVRRLKIISSANLMLIIFSFQLLILLRSTLKSLSLVASTRHASLNLVCLLEVGHTTLYNVQKI